MVPVNLRPMDKATSWSKPVWPGAAEFCHRHCQPDRRVYGVPPYARAQRAARTAIAGTQPAGRGRTVVKTLAGYVPWA